MDYFDLISESIQTLWLNKLRTALATLGIVIGIGSVIALVSLGQSTQISIANQIQSLGSNLLTVQPGQINQAGGVRTGGGGATTLTLSDALDIATNPKITTVSTVSPEFSRRTQVTTGSNNTNTQVVGVTPGYIKVHNGSLTSGVFISQTDVDTMSKVAVIGPTTVVNLFGDGSDPLGATIRINGQSFTIVGVTKAKGGTGFQNPDDIIFVPLTTAQKQVFGVNYLSSIALEAKSSDLMRQTQDDVGNLLLARHNKTDPAQADFTIFSQQDLLTTVSSTSGTFTTLLSGVAAISLLVGGIGIMNIMLVTVTERTREIGLKKAIGAPKKVIITQFLLESAFLTFGGGIIGILLGITVSYFISVTSNTPFIVSLSSVFLAFVISVVIGIIFGAYPAQKAAALQPIEALRYE